MCCLLQQTHIPRKRGFTFSLHFLFAVQCFTFAFDVSLLNHGKIMAKYKTKTFLLHRLVVEAELGRSLHKGEEVHHIDHDSMNNHPDNLELCSSRYVHAQHHRKREKKLQPLIEIDGLWF
jgi:hypothetical protein